MVAGTITLPSYFYIYSICFIRKCCFIPLLILGAIVFLSLFGLTNYYIGLKVYNFLIALIPVLNGTVYWIIFGIIALSFILGRINSKIIPVFIKDIFNLIGSFWMAIMLYGLMLFLIIDLVSFILPYSRLHDIMELYIPNFNLYGNTLVLVIIIGIIVYGTYHARNIKVNSYNIIIPKNSTVLNNLTVVFLSDTHLGNIVNNRRLEHIVDKINSLAPDIVLFGGDIIDDSIKPYIKQNMSATLRKIKSTYGVYAVLGNHDGTFRHQTYVINNLENGRMKVLVDEYVKINEAFYLAGRVDNSMPRGGSKREPLEEILKDVDKSLPIILIDHSPAKFWEAQQQNVDLQLSGHTHGGQFFPISFITKNLFATDWGYLKKENFQLIVSSGTATWGPPLRLGTNSEIVKVNIEFEGN